jgi:hypothetical protein
MLPTWPTTLQNKSTCNSYAGIWVRVAAHTNASYYMLLTAYHSCNTVWLQRTVQLWNKLANVDPDTWLAHRAFVANIRLWQSGDNDCWAARTIGHLSHLGVIDTNIPELWSVQLQPAQVEISMYGCSENSKMGVLHAALLQRSAQHSWHRPHALLLRSTLQLYARWCEKAGIPQHPTVAVAAYPAASYWPDQTSLHYVTMAGLP